jgi:lipoic acid synthetase
VEAGCPNKTACFKDGQATFLILGDICTRNCKFCGVKQSPGAKLSLDLDEPKRLSGLVKDLRLNYVVITSVTRDDLSDGGAAIFARSIKLIRKRNKGIKVEALIPDFQNKLSSLRCLLDAHPFVVAHNIETVRRLYYLIRPMADYSRSLMVLKRTKKLRPDILTKSSVMLGLGESRQEVMDTMRDLRENYCDILTIGQYLAPSIRHYPVKKFIPPEDFKEYEPIALAMGFKKVFCGPLVRSSYQAERISREVIHA